MSGIFDITAVAFDYDGKTALRDLSLTIEAGLFYGIIGPNGCGKSTLIDLMLRHRRPAAGRIRFKGKTLKAYARKHLACEMALVPQNFYINFPFTAGEVVMMGRYPYIPRFASPAPADLQRVRDIMIRTETLDFENRFVTELSGGERQRVIFARALAQDASVLLLDEATSNMDIRHAVRLMHLVCKGVREKKKTAVAVIQDVNLAAAYCDRLIFMKHGSVVAHGPVADILTPENIKAVFEVDGKVYFEPYTASPQVIFKK